MIPVYNQIHYTYLCLASILEHTKDVSYEIVIADDVSGDATEHLGEFAEGITICRNETNQGFLRNCNHAAKSARGRYIMFLNNDTQVTEGWLSSLVSLIQSDDSIGMVGSSWFIRTAVFRRREASSGATVRDGITAVWIIRTRPNIIM